jgi:hypothetical protein
MPSRTILLAPPSGLRAAPARARAWSLAAFLAALLCLGVPLAQAQTVSLWDSTATPARLSDPDPNPVELGVKFRSSAAGSITGLRFYKGPGNGGTHTGRVWAASGALLGTLTFTNETASGWQQSSFANPIPLQANTTYIASYHAPVGRYAADNDYFATTGVTSGPLSAPATGAVAGNGVYRYGPAGGFPVETFQASNYWVDVVFLPSGGTPDTTPPTVTSTTPSGGATAVNVGTTVTAAFSEALNGSTVSAETFVLRGPGGSGVPATVGYNATNSVATLAPGSPLAASTTYTATVVGGANGVRDVAGNALATDVIWAFTTAAQGGTECPCSLWSPSTTPATASHPDPNAVELGVKFQSSVAGSITAIRFYKGTGNTGGHVGHLWTTGGALLGTATFSGETAAGWQQASFPSPIPIQANTTYIASYHAPAGQYAVNGSYFASTGVASGPLSAPASAAAGGNGVYRYGPAGGFPSDTFNATNYWVDVVFATSTGGGTPPPPPPPPAGTSPLLLVTSGGFSSYYAEILRAEGLNLFDSVDGSALSAGLLSGYDAVLLGEAALTATQVSLLTDWVNAGGHLVAMRPDKRLAPLLGLTDGGTTLTNAYLLIATGSAPGAGLVNQTIQFKGTADRYTLSGATALATLYSGVNTATANPAVTWRSVGPSGGSAAAFAFDLARSVVHLRQGNPAWSGQERDGFPPIRSNDLYFGAASFDPQPDWVNLNKVAIPQADEQQRLLANLLIWTTRARKPLPRFWYLPRDLSAVVLMTGDDHGTGGTAGRFEQFLAASPPGCSVESWECVRSTSYLYPNSPLTDAQAAAYTRAGFEVSLHLNTGCANWNPASLDGMLGDSLFQFRSRYPSAGAVETHRTHCLVWSDYTSGAEVQRNHGIRADANYYYWPPGWIQNRPGLFTGSGMPMRFARADGSLVDAYQLTTQMTDESGQTYPFTVDTLLDRALGPLGYYGVFTANMHTDQIQSSGSDAIIASARARGVPVVSARQVLTWLDGRNGSELGGLSFSGGVLRFGLAAGQGATGLRAMVPMQGRSVTAVRRDGASLPFSTRTVKGVAYAVFDAQTGTYEVTFQ